MDELLTWRQISKLLRTHADGQQKITDYSLGVTEKEFFEFEEIIHRSIQKNGWFTEENVRFSLLQISKWIEEPIFQTYFRKYYDSSNGSRNIAVIMAGNIPLVGFHDFICVLMSGYRVICKMSHEDDLLLKGVYNYIHLMNPMMAQRIRFSDRKLDEFHGIIATGNESSNESFRRYFGNKRHIFRGHRTSIAILNGKESDDDLNKLGDDIFHYFGKGCRNVTHICLPINFDIQRIFKSILPYKDVILNKKYGNNYDYNKAVYLMNNIPILDNNFVLLKEDTSLFSPLSVIHYHYYKNSTDINEFILLNKDKIQCVVGKEYTPFGSAQSPAFNDFADDKNTLEWLSEISEK